MRYRRTRASGASRCPSMQSRAASTPGAIESPLPGSVLPTSIAAPVADVNLRPQAGVLALAVMVASGFAGLGYQIVWTQQSALWLGHESAAVLAVVAAFFGGLAT